MYNLSSNKDISKENSLNNMPLNFKPKHISYPKRNHSSSKQNKFEGNLRNELNLDISGELRSPKRSRIDQDELAIMSNTNLLDTDRINEQLSTYSDQRETPMWKETKFDFEARDP